MTHTLKEHSEQLLKVIDETESYLNEIQEETTNAMVQTTIQEVDKYLLEIGGRASSIDYLLEDMEQTHEQWLDEQIKRLLLLVNYDRKKINQLLSTIDLDRQENNEILEHDEKITSVSDLIINELNETKYKDTKYKANENAIRVWLMSMITLHHYMFERGNLKYSESFNPYVILDLDK